METWKPGIFIPGVFIFKNIFVCFKNDIIFVIKIDNMALKKYTVLEIALLATAFKKSPQTISRWIKSKDDRLTSEKAKEALGIIKSPKK